MPRGNGMGPNGNGPMSGRGAGYCAGFDVPGFANPGQGRGFGGGFGGGRGRGFRNRFHAMGRPGGQFGPMQPLAQESVSVAEERAMLQRRKDVLEAQLREVNEALNTDNV